MYKIFIFFFSITFIITNSSLAHDVIPKILIKYPDNRWKMAYYPISQSIPTDEEISRDDLINKFIDRHRDNLGYDENTMELRLAKISYSLLGSHYTYHHYHDDLRVEESQLIISLTQNGQIYLLYNALSTKNAPAIASPSLLESEKAFQIVWEDLSVNGKLTGPPSAKIVWHHSKDQLIRSYKITLSTQEPHGTWIYMIDSQSGQIISRKNTLIPIKPFQKSIRSTRPVLDRTQAFADYYFSQLESESEPEDVHRQDGSALIFIPDPLTHLKDPQLHDNSLEEQFESAYVVKSLADLLVRNNIFHLEGPWVKIADWSAPATQPSTTTDGIWSNKRGNSSFNDVMTYFHLDQSQRYLQSLGFNDQAGVINYPIIVDSDGFSGADNSFYDPTNRRLAFGHGCVDDNEDTDVILHEYGHAIQHHIVEEWGGGDAGAIGEGFGDYWATSNRYSLPNSDFELFKVFSWDASSGCWNGRRTDRITAVYHSDQTYRAHGHETSFVHDELWSTPLTQTLVDLTNQGVPRHEVDAIVIQSHFGLSSGISMANMALATIQAAKMLYPTGPHADAFTSHFQAQGLISNTFH